MEKLKNKHKHALTQWVKVIIFGILMLAPFMSIGARCLYVICNKNAKDSYYGETINEELIVRDTTLKNNEIYYYNSVDTSYTFGQTGTIYATDFEYLDGNLIATDITNIQVYENIRFNFVYTGEGGSPMVQVYGLDENNNYAFIVNLFPRTNTFIFKFFVYNSLSTNSFDFNQLYRLEYNNYSYLDNAFEYSVNHLADEQWIAWTKNTGIYTPINAMTSGLGFDAQTNVLAILLTYWSLLTAVYIVFDIVIVCFTKITHLISGSD